MSPDTQQSNTWWGTLRRVYALPKLQVTMMAVWVLFVAIVAINVGNRFGDIWGAFVGIFVGPLVLARIMRSGLGTNSGKHSRPR
jgi:hypothetical protein